ncbi:hypothetical protein [Thiocystis violacea]|uniref:hypothetical protein n=1 Tax=Thiocystis violacea TaxID=13725 RepID=UPI00190591A3|nr:hypothetical protein [Thiocystis violacea]
MSARRPGIPDPLAPHALGRGPADRRDQSTAEKGRRQVCLAFTQDSRQAALAIGVD